MQGIIKRALAVAGVTALAGSAVLVTATAASATSGQEPHKSYVCKYVTTPGDAERLQTGQNPIWVDNHSIKGNDQDEVSVGDSFTDGQNRSVVIVANTVKLDPEPGVDQCPAPNQPEPVDCTTRYDFPAQKMWEVTWGHGFADRNGGAPTFTMDSNGGLIELDGKAVPAYMTPGWHWLYVTDGREGGNNHTYLFADGTLRTVTVTIGQDADGCAAPSIVWTTKAFESQTEERVVDGTPDCDTLTVVQSYQRRHTTAPKGEWTPWEQYDNGTRPATVKDCPLPDKPAPIVENSDWTGTPDCLAGTYTESRTVTTTDWTLVGREYVKAEPVVTTETRTVNVTDEQCPLESDFNQTFNEQLDCDNGVVNWLATWTETPYSWVDGVKTAGEPIIDSSSGVRDATVRECPTVVTPPTEPPVVTEKPQPPVVAAPAAPAASAEPVIGEALAFTGINVWVYVGLGVALLLAGLVLLTGRALNGRKTA